VMVTIEVESAQKKKQHAVSGFKGIPQCKDTWRFNTSIHSDDNLNVYLSKKRVFAVDKPIAKCSLPLGWFATNRIVRDWFPLTEENEPEGRNPIHWILMDVHINAHQDRAFSANFAPLTVNTTWARPGDDYVECPVPAPLFVCPAPMGNQMFRYQQPRTDDGIPPLAQSEHAYYPQAALSDEPAFGMPPTWSDQ